jgi:hypothetical protein
VIRRTSLVDAERLDLGIAWVEVDIGRRPVPLAIASLVEVALVDSTQVRARTMGAVERTIVALLVVVEDPVATRVEGHVCVGTGRGRGADVVSEFVVASVVDGAGLATGEGDPREQQRRGERRANEGDETGHASSSWYRARLGFRGAPLVVPALPVLQADAWC